MAILHVLRSGLYMLRGRLERAQLDAAARALWSGTLAPAKNADGTLIDENNQPKYLQSVLSCANEVRVPVYMGYRMSDAFGHINNSRYLEAFEFGRWHSFFFTGLTQRMRYAGVYPTISGLDIQFLKEIKPGQFVVCKSRGPFLVADDQRSLMYVQQLESPDGKQIFSTVVMRICMLNLPTVSLSQQAKRMKKTAKGVIPPAEVMERLFCFKEERDAAMVFHPTQGSAEGWEGTLFHPPLVQKLNESENNWRATVLSQIKKTKGVS